MPVYAVVGLMTNQKSGETLILPIITDLELNSARAAARVRAVLRKAFPRRDGWGEYQVAISPVSRELLAKASDSDQLFVAAGVLVSNDAKGDSFYVGVMPLLATSSEAARHGARGKFMREYPDARLKYLQVKGANE